MCLNKRVIGALVAVAAGAYMVAPNLLLSALPLLLLAACPLSMLFMGKAMGMGGQRASQSEQAAVQESGGTLSPAEQMALLRMQLQRVGEQQAALEQLQAVEAQARSSEALQASGKVARPAAVRM